MAATFAMARLVFAALPQLLLSGWAALLLGLACVIVYVQYRRVAHMQVELLGVPKQGPWQQVAQSLLMGLMGGVVGSIMLTILGVGMVEPARQASTLLYLWPVSIALAAINPRFVCTAYAGSLVSVVSLLTGWPQVDVPVLAGLVALLHVVEAVLVWASGDTCPTPITFEGQHGAPVAGFVLQRFWPVPLILPFFSLAASAPLDVPAWWPLLPPDLSLLGGESVGWSLMPIVVTMGYSDLAVTTSPEHRTRRSALVMLGYSIVLFMLAMGAVYWPPLNWAAALFCGLGHEAMVVLAGRLELVGQARLTKPPRGVSVLDVLPRSLAEAGGIRSGSVILAVDTMEVNTRSELHDALMAAPSYVQILYRREREVHACRVPRPENGIIGLGTVLVPEPEDQAVARVRRPSFFRWSGLEQ